VAQACNGKSYIKFSVVQRFINQEVNFNPFLLIVIFFVLLNSVKIDFLDHFSIFPYFSWPISHPSLKLLLYVIVNALIFFSALRFKNIIPFLLIYVLQTLYLFVHLSYVLYFDAPFHARQFIVDLYEGVLLLRHLSIPMNIKYLTLVADLPLLIATILCYSKIRRFLASEKKIINYLLIGFVVLLLCFIPFSYHAYRIAEDIKNQYRGEIFIIDKLGLIGNDLLDLLELKNEESIIANFGKGARLVARTKNPNQVHNIICIQVETLDSNIIDYTYKNKYVCPFLHQLSSECIYYPYTLFYRFVGGSGDTEFATINGIIPSMKFPSFKIRNYSYPNSIIKRLIRSGFDSKGFHNNEGNYFNRKVAFFKMGFHDFYDIIDMHLQENGWGAPDHEMFNFVKEKLKKQKTPFFYYVITMSSHEPFTIVQGYYRNNIYADIADFEVRGYLNSLSYVDFVLQDFVTFVRDNLKDTYIFIYGDHDAYALLDHKSISLKSMGVPLFIITPDNKKYRETKEIASLLDLAQTILYASGIKFEVMTRGTNLLQFPIKNSPIAVNDCETYDREILFGKERASRVNSCN
jgi:lipoteichoic acid synthase